MNRSDLISAIKSETELTNNESEKIVNEFFGAITQTLANNERVEIRGFGSFSVNGYKPYVGRNPKTGVKINVPSKKLPFFKVGKELKHRVDQV
ncbi:MAG: integration host factor subunit beta [Desulfobacterales bacterium]|jgi:integration host factor subunit beta|nr:integration host factor subunit beta [Deltaproteobacteria bacterium]NNK84505.1 integration host factor subunit beta [Desulfobacterales bacterium]NNL41793.1 integration host factor subunit beta [Desulfobacterales bacterium]